MRRAQSRNFIDKPGDHRWGDRKSAQFASPFDRDRGDWLAVLDAGRLNFDPGAHGSHHVERGPRRVDADARDVHCSAWHHRRCNEEEYRRRWVAGYDDSFERA